MKLESPQDGRWGDVVKAARTADVRMAREVHDALYGTMLGTRTRRIANGNGRMAMIINQLQRRCCGALSAQPASVITARGLCVVHARSFRPLVSRLRYESFEHEHAVAHGRCRSWRTHLVTPTISHVVFVRKCWASRHHLLHRRPYLSLIYFPGLKRYEPACRCFITATSRQRNLKEHSYICRYVRDFFLSRQHTVQL